MFRLPALLCGLGLLSLYFVCARATRRPWTSLTAVAVLGMSMPMLYIARDTFSESATFALLWGGLLCASMAVRRTSPIIAAAAGWILGATTATRVDSLLYLGALLPVALAWGLWPGFDRRARAWTAMAFVGGGLLPLVIGTIDLEWFTGGYSILLVEETLSLRVGTGIALIIGMLAALVGPKLQKQRWWKGRGIAFAAASVVVFVLLFMWFVRPVLLEDHGKESPVLTGYQTREGLEKDSTRTHWEAAFAWFEWYFGPVVVIAFVLGSALLAYGAARGNLGAEQTILLMLILSGVLFWLNPRIFSDQPWASRRFARATYPAAVAIAVYALARISSQLRQRAVPGARIISIAAAVTMVVSTGLITWPVRWGHAQYGYQVAMESLCEQIGTAAAAVVVDQTPHKQIPPGVRAVCNIPTVALKNPTRSDLESLALDWSGHGRELWLVSDDPEPLSSLLGPNVETVTSHPGAGTSEIERTLTHAPLGYRAPVVLTLLAARVPLP